MKKFIVIYIVGSIFLVWNINPKTTYTSVEQIGSNFTKEQAESMARVPAEILGYNRAKHFDHYQEGSVTSVKSWIPFVYKKVSKTHIEKTYLRPVY